jgi:class 3 adenylate cyclase
MNPVSSWLASVGFERYAEAFEAEDISVDVLSELTEADLKELGVATLGDRKRLLKAIGALASPPAAPVLPPSAATATVSSTTAPAPLPFHEAERRQLTVMFCDMVGSTQLSARLDPEDLQNVVRRFHAAIAGAVAAFDGHVAQLLGDGVLVYFGYPRAHEDDAGRAVHAALAALDAVARLRPLGDIVLQTRIGIATGMVVVGEIGSGTSAAEQTASGETPNLAARLQGHAGPGEIVMSDETRHLVGAAFELAPLGALALKGFAAPVEAWRVVGARSVASRFEAQHDEELIALIGRDSEVALLMERWALACDGEGQVVLLSGEAGIGKSRITHTLRERLAGSSAATVLLQCSPYYSDSALYPLVRYFERVTHMAPEDSDEVRTAKLARLTGSELEFPATSFGYLLRMMGLPDGGRVPASAGDQPMRENAQLLQAPIDLLRRLSTHHPVLLLIEDAHWIDPTSEQVVAQSIEQLADARVLILVTCRPEYTPSWGNPAHLTRLALNRLGQKQSMALVAAVTGGKRLPPEVLAEIIRKTDGIPLFVEELTKTVVQSGLLEETPDGYRLNGALPLLAIPSTLQDSLMARLDRLAPAKEVAQVSALIGREFSHRLLAEVLQMPEAKLAAALDDLVRAELVVPRDPPPNASFSFKHALIRDTASNSLLKSQWVLRHAQIAAAIERIDPDTVESQPELLAYHFQEGGEPVRAFEFRQRAADHAIRRIAYREAVTQLRAALALLPKLPAGSGGEAVELDLQMKLGQLLMQIDGYAAPQTSACFARSRELASRLGQSDTYVIACSALSATLWASGRYQDVIDMLGHFDDGEIAGLAPMSRVFRALVLGLAEMHLGDLPTAWVHSAEAMRELESVPLDRRVDIGGIEPMVMVLSQMIAVLVNQGYLERAATLTAQALEIAERRAHEPSIVWARSLARWAAFRRGDMAESMRLSRELLLMAERLGFHARIATGQMMLGRALVANGDVDEGRRLLREGHAAWAAAGAVATGSEYASHAAEVLLNAGDPEEAAYFVRAGERMMAETGERFYAAELIRQRGRLAECGVIDEPAEAQADAGPASEAAPEGPGRRQRLAERFYRRAIDVAEGQQAKLFTLRAATDLARLLKSEGRAAEADLALRPVYAWFTEGFDFPDLQRARALLG